MIRGMAVREIIPVLVWIIPFLVLKINYEPLGSNVKHFVKGVYITGLDVREIIPFPVWIIPFPV